MEITGVMSGNAPWVEAYQVGETGVNAGVPWLITTTTEAGLALAGVQDAADMVGISYDTAVVLTAQPADGSSAEARVELCINPNVVLNIRLNGGSTSGTALTSHAITIANAAGTSIVVSSSFASPELKFGTVWFYKGSNVSQSRRITGTSGGTATVATSFQFGTTTNDEILRCNLAEPCTETIKSVKLTTDFTECDVTTLVQTSDAELQVISLHLFDQASDGKTESYARVMPADHIFGGRA